MYRDLDLLRQLLFAVEARSEEDALRDTALTVAGYDVRTVAHHVDLMQEGGLVESHVVQTAGMLLPEAHVFRMTWAGHEFLDAVRNVAVWRKTVQAVHDLGGGAPLAVMHALALRYAMEHFGLPIDRMAPDPPTDARHAPGLDASSRRARDA